MDNSKNKAEGTSGGPNFLAKWQSRHEFLPSSENIEDLIQQFKSIEHFLPNDQLIIINKLQTLTPAYVTPNVQNILGYTQEEFLNLSQEHHLPPDGYYNFNYLNELLVCDKENKAEIASKGFIPSFLMGYMFGHRKKAKDNTVKNFLVTNHMAVDEKFGIPSYLVIYLSQIDHLINSTPTFWFYLQAINSDDSFTKLTKYDENRHTYNFLISPREKEVISLIAGGMSSKEAAVVLELSSGTIDKHRKNVIHRLGVRDTTSLIQVLRICGEL